MSKTSIDWSEMTWNPVTGCSKISEGCKYCYAEKMSLRLKAMGQEKYRNGFQLTMHEECLEIPYKWNKRRKIFVNSMSDLFHTDVPTEFIQKVFKVMNDNPHHIFQVLTKRADNLYEMDNAGLLNWSDNIMMGVTIENAKTKSRLDLLSQTGAKTKFLSCEPLIGKIGNMDLTKTDWVIVGGESGPNARPAEKDWIMDIKNQCMMGNIPFFFKQWGGKNKKKAGKLLDGKIWHEIPEIMKKGVKIA